MTMEVTRIERAMIALHDYGTREGATAKKVRKQMMADGFTNKEIDAAATAMQGGKR